MNPEILLRFLGALVITAAGIGLYFLVSFFSLQRARNQLTGLEQVKNGKPVLVYFTTPTCAPCKTIQRPAIQRLQMILGDRLQVVEIDAASRPEVASDWGVLSVPTTFVLDQFGKPQHVNHGVASYEKLLHQMGSLSPGGKF